MSMIKTALIASALTLAVVGTASARSDQWHEGNSGYASVAPSAQHRATTNYYLDAQRPSSGIANNNESTEWLTDQAKGAVE